MQPKSEIEKAYETPDPWGYKTNPEDIRRRSYLADIAASMKIHNPNGYCFERLLDIGAGEGWITEIYPATTKHAFELSDNAAARLPKGITRVNPPQGKYDLVTANGIFYGHYDWKHFMSLIKEHASHIVLISSIESWEHACVNSIGKEIYRATFPYREFTQRVRIFNVSTS